MSRTLPGILNDEQRTHDSTTYEFLDPLTLFIFPKKYPTKEYRSKRIFESTLTLVYNRNFMLLDYPLFLDTVTVYFQSRLVKLNVY